MNKPVEPDHTVADLIQRRLGELTPTERKAAVLLLGNYPVPGLQTVAQFAVQAKVSNPTILRLVSKLGFKTYGDFQLRLRDELEARIRSPLTKEVTREFGAEGTDAGPVQGYWTSVTRALVASMHMVQSETVEETVSLLADHGRPVLIIGGRLTASAAQQMFLHLSELRPNVSVIDKQTGSWADSLLDIKGCVIVAFDIRRYQDDIIRFGREAVERGAQLILITDEWVSPLAAVATHVFPLRIAVESHWDSFVPISALVETLIARLSVRDWDCVKARVETLEAIRGRIDR